MIALALVCIAALIGYRIALKEMENPLFETISDIDRCKIIAIGMGCSVVIVGCVLKLTGAI